MSYSDLRDFLSQLDKKGELKRISVPVSPRLEMTEICDRVLRAGGPALLFERPAGHVIPVLGNLFGTVGRVAAMHQATRVQREVRAAMLAAREIEPGDRCAGVVHSRGSQSGRLNAIPAKIAPPIQLAFMNARQQPSRLRPRIRNHCQTIMQAAAARPA